VVYAGVPGSFSHKACVQFFGAEVPYQSCPLFREVFEAVENGDATLGIVPLENSFTGSIHENYDLLLEYDLHIVGELTLRIEHNLIGHPDTSLNNIKRVYSHPQVFQQCKEFLKGYPNWDLGACQDTATAVLRVKENNNEAEAAIAAARLLNSMACPCWKKGLNESQDHTRFTSFRPVSSSTSPRTNLPDLLSAISRGARRSLEDFCRRQIICETESRPIHSKPWEYLFYTDIEVDIHDSLYRPLLEELKKKTEFLKILGSYAKGLDDTGKTDLSEKAV
jgi:prephenate dehydratase